MYTYFTLADYFLDNPLPESNGLDPSLLHCSMCEFDTCERGMSAFPSLCFFPVLFLSPLPSFLPALPTLAILPFGLVH
jgi:hypothetical protein